MDRNSVRPMHVAIILILFWSAWLYSEISEYQMSAKKWERIEGFMQIGDRFTTRNGAALEARVTGLENRLKEHCEEQ